ncbi:4Fe-4S dicluster domain-containing protein [Sporomusa termitida]|uniref:[FeFe] hydrogenase, group B1/B3 n=1 Tax=Sporomusa termitida TaxID=2377 RepID=A0A517E0V5_9FIRM|nr:4Fe-4S dicluster domain-containing protein [Sporomusa termitida]QDR83208.1 [FeFe] hydrogenase, group B1/B3 [Sporomusa termitida]
MAISQVTEVVIIRNKVLTEIARMAYNGSLDKDIGSMPDTIVSEAGPRYRCCIHKERAVLRQRINLTLSQSLELTQAEAAAGALAGEIEDMPFIHVLPEACDQCPIDKFLVTDACRNCLAHNCINSCPKKAILVVQNRAYIDKTRCVECGLCKKSCQYGAIIEISRPCERVCAVKAIIAGSDRKAVINQDKCVECGACREACPFGAISDRSLVVQVIQQIKSGKQVYAILAPAFAGHFGARTKPGQLINAIRQLGFHAVQEVAYGADIVSIKEANEFLATVPAQRPYMTSSCCPAFVALVEKHFPDMTDCISSTVSPMLAMAQIIKNSNPEAVIVFIGPCIAKKSEARRNSALVDFVLTFEELDAMLAGKGIDISTLDDSEFQSAASTTANAFACAGGVANAVQAAVAGLAPAVTVKAHSTAGLDECANALKQIRSGTLEANFLEGMSCVGGCIGGPAGLANVRVAGRLVAAFANSSAAKSALTNKAAQADSEQPGHWHRQS